MLMTGSPRESPSVFTVGPGLISEYGTLMNTPAQSSANSMRVEASIVAVRRGMDRQYVTALTGGRRGRSVRGPYAELSADSQGASPGTRHTASEPEWAAAFALA